MLLQTFAKRLQHVDGNVYFMLGINVIANNLQNVCITLHGNVYFRLELDVIANIRKTFTARCKYSQNDPRMLPFDVAKAETRMLAKRSVLPGTVVPISVSHSKTTKTTVIYHKVNTVYYCTDTVIRSKLTVIYRYVNIVYYCTAVQ